MDDYLAFARTLAYQGGQLIVDNFDISIDSEMKADKTPVTWVDKKINDLVAEAIAHSYPEHGLLGEENNLGDGSEEYQWLCDPLDGTKCFILGIPQCTFMLALTTHGKILLSVVYNPFTKQLYHAITGQGAFCNDVPIHVNDNQISEAYVLVEASAFPMVADVIALGAQVEPVAGTGYKCVIIASGRGSAIMKGEGDFHDIGPGSLIIEEAGGRVTGYDGETLLFNQKIPGGVVLSNGVIHDQLLGVIAHHSK